MEVGFCFLLTGLPLTFGFGFVFIEAADFGHIDRFLAYFSVFLFLLFAEREVIVAQFGLDVKLIVLVVHGVV